MRVQHLNYRSDIDGLRAWAILPVVIFHAFPNLLPGGFVGVDVFFVISGYLITSILLKDMSAGIYNIRSFYARRVRRIFPALITVLLFCFVLGWVVLTPREYQSLGKHISGGAGFVANIMFWKEAGYFDPAADTKPLLHLWSLGIEEQFYIFWPLLLFFAYQKKWNLYRFILSVGALSFLVNIGLLLFDPTGDFYSPWSRSWELALGALLAYLGTQHSEMMDWVNNHQPTISFLGLFLLTLSFVVVPEGKNFPGFWALIPSVGAALLIASGPNSWVSRQVLSNRVIVFFGLISFPLYLWHWPLLSFSRIIFSETSPVGVRIILILISIFLAWVTYLLIEKPIRSRSRSSLMIWSLSLLMLITGLAGLGAYKTRGVPTRHFAMLNADPASLVLGVHRDSLLNECGIPESAKDLLDKCFSDPREVPEYGVWGDSKAEAIFYGLVQESSPGHRWMMIGSMIPAISDAPHFVGGGGRNAKRNQYAVDAFVNNKNLKAVVLAPAARSLFAVGEVYTHEDMANSPNYAEALAGVGRAIDYLEKSGKRVIFLIDNPGFPDPRSCISGGLTQSAFLNQFLFRKVNPHCAMTYEQFMFNSERYRLWVNELQKNHPHLVVYDPTSIVCDIAKNRCDTTKEGKFLYSYGDHYSDYGNSLVAKDFLAKLPQLLKN